MGGGIPATGRSNVEVLLMISVTPAICNHVRPPLCSVLILISVVAIIKKIISAITIMPSTHSTSQVQCP